MFDEVNELNNQLHNVIKVLKKQFVERIVYKEQGLIDHYNKEIELLKANFDEEFKKQLQR